MESKFIVALFSVPRHLFDPTSPHDLPESLIETENIYQADEVWTRESGLQAVEQHNRQQMETWSEDDWQWCVLAEVAKPSELLYNVEIDPLLGIGRAVPVFDYQLSLVSK